MNHLLISTIVYKFLFFPYFFHALLFHKLLMANYGIVQFRSSLSCKSLASNNLLFFFCKSGCFSSLGKSWRSKENVKRHPDWEFRRSFTFTRTRDKDFVLEAVSEWKRRNPCGRVVFLGTVLRNYHYVSFLLFHYAIASVYISCFCLQGRHQ